MRPEYRSLFLALAGVFSLAAPTAAGDAGRYSLSAGAEGFVRLDTATGAVSHCRRENGVWRCEPLAAEDSSTRARLDALAAQVARLTAAVAALDARVAALAPVAAVAPKPASPRPAAETPGLMSRFLDFVRVLKHGRPTMPDAT